MTRLEMVEKIREKTGVTYEAARETLEKCNWDMLDAIVSIERQNVQETVHADPAPESEPVYTAEPESTPPVQKKRVIRRATNGEVGDKIASILRWLGGLIRKGEESHIEVTRKDESILSLSITSLVLLFMLTWFVPAVLIIVGLFTGYKFHFVGTGIAGKIVNSASEKASAKADEIKSKLNEEQAE